MVSIHHEPKIILVTGVMASGKSTVAELLAQQLNPSMHLRGDLYRKMIVNGREEMGFSPTKAAMEQLWLRYRSSYITAHAYHQSGFNVVYQDVIIGPILSDVVAQFRDLPLYVVVLSPNRQAVEQREATRSKKGYVGFSVEQLLQIFSETPQMGLWVDSSSQSSEETARYVSNNLEKARVLWQ